VLDPIKEGAVWAIFFLPLSSFAIITLVSFLGLTRSGAWNPRYSGYLTTAAIFGSFLLSLWALDSVADSDGARIGFDAHEWLTIGGLEVNIGITLDGLTGVMLVVVTGVSFLVQVYSQEYMRGDEGYSRYFAFMSLFTTSMLGLVLASSVLQLFVFWELVGLCSYLLIGFWFQKDSARRAAVKAFMVTRIGDLGFMIALLIVFTQTGSLEIDEIHEAAIAGAIGSTALTFFALGLFAGAAGKSAQFPLHTWLPDAMEGPTPVSALIHAATMVAAGVYLVARFFPVFAESEDALLTIAIIGSITTIIAALLGIVATDIKRVMAYSTISQLGYMMMGLGVGGMVAAIFHLFTHAFFKALLFLGAGSVNHATGTFDMRLMGGLRKYMPITYGTMLVACLALVGILLYVGRMIIMTFWGEYRGGLQAEDEEHKGDAHAGAHHRTPHESPALMTLPLIVLAVLALGAGFLNAPGVDWLGEIIEGWLPHETEELLTHTDFELWIAVASVATGLAGLGTAWAIYQVKLLDLESLRAAFDPLPLILENRYYLDYLYETIFVKTLVLGSARRGLAFWDQYVIDGAVNDVALATTWSAKQLRLAQTGQVQLYGGVMFLGTIAAIVGILVVNP